MSDNPTTPASLWPVIVELVRNKMTVGAVVIIGGIWVLTVKVGLPFYEATRIDLQQMQAIVTQQKAIMDAMERVTERLEHISERVDAHPGAFGGGGP